MKSKYCDVIVVGGGNAALCAAMSAKEHGAKVLVLERAPEAKRGGNSRFTGGGFRMVHKGLEDIKEVVPELSAEDIAITDFGQYTAEQYLDDLGRTTQYNIDPELAEILVDRSTDTVKWIRKQGVKFEPQYGRQAFKVNGRYKFTSGVVVNAIGAGQGLVEGEYKAIAQQGIELRYGAHVMRLLRGKEGINGVSVVIDGEEEQIYAGAVVLACGGFEANREWRTRYLGPGWELVKVRGTRYNTGEGIRMALEIGAQSYGHWSASHACPFERYAPDFGNLEKIGAGIRHSYPMGIMVNAEGKRFVDEGADWRNFTYVKYGPIVLKQPGSYAWQVFDTQTTHLLRGEYKMRGGHKVEADTLEELVKRMEDVEPKAFLETVREFNASIKKDAPPFDPNIKDGRGTVGLALPKSNWATALDKPPYTAYSIGCGITFTFGGIKIDKTSRVLDMADDPMRGLYAGGEIVGGLFYFNYPSSSGLMAGAVFGRTAGREAALFALGKTAE